jgi:hypothetical protein
MYTLLFIPGLFVLIFVLVGVAALHYHIFHPHGYEVSPKQVRAGLQKILDGVDPWAWDDFMTGRIKDPRLEAIRLRVAQLGEEFPPESQGELFGPKGLEVIRGYIRELEHEAPADSNHH